MKYTILTAFIVFTSASFALEDTSENRSKEADRYLVATPPKEMFTDMASNIAKSMPEAQRAEFVSIITDKIDLVAMEKSMRDGLVKVFTADELKALADFYNSAEGKSSMKKMGLYMGAIMPDIQAQVQKAMQSGVKSSSDIKAAEQDAAANP